jgi:hypothetical protein
MPSLIDQALEELKNMSTDARDGIARDLLDLTRAERKWEASFADPRSDAMFERMA